MMGDASLFGDVTEERIDGLIAAGRAKVELFRLNAPKTRRLCEGCGDVAGRERGWSHAAEFKIEPGGETWQLYLCDKCAKDMEREIRKCEPEEEER